MLVDEQNEVMFYVIVLNCKKINIGAPITTPDKFSLGPVAMETKFFVDSFGPVDLVPKFLLSVENILLSTSL
jgi:hypothetical protein